MSSPTREAGAENMAVRAFLGGELSALDAADAGGLAVSDLLDLAERVRAADGDTGAGGHGAGATPPDISVVIPMYNEEGNLGDLLGLLVPVLEGIGTYEVVFVDDHSSDRSRELVLEARAANPSICLVELARNFGHQGALTAGLDYAHGRSVVLMDADLQDPPELLAELAAKWREGYEVVYAVREKRKEGPFLRASFFLFYRLLGAISEIELPFDSGDFCLMDRKVVDALRALPEANRYLRGLRGWVGFRQVGVHYERGARHSGETKYTVRDRVRFAVDGLLAFSNLPLRLSSLIGLLSTAGALVYLLVALYAKIVNGAVPNGWTSIIFVVLMIGGVQLLMMGVMGEYLARTYQETKRRPGYVVSVAHGTTRLGRPGRG